ncbi:MAG: transketolase C-terminal domain-containing protein [Candidatus Spechtbacterales bacterium]
MDYYLDKNYLNPKKVESKKMRDGAGIGIAELGETKKDVVVLGADTAGSARASFFAKKFPKRFIQCGVAEQNMTGIAAGLAYEGMVPYAITYAAFLIGRAWEPIRTTVAYPENHVIYVASHVGIATGSDGPTHQMTEDITLTRCLPGFTVIAPADYEQARKAVKAAYDLKGPVYIRNVRDATPNFTTEQTPFEIGKAQVLREGKDITVVGHGLVVHSLLLLAEELKNEVSLEVINMHTIEPLDGDTLLTSAKKTGKVFTAEDHNIRGGMGSAVAEFLSENNPVPMKLHGVMDEFTESGTMEDLLKKYKLDKEGIKEVLLDFVKI